jgi:hypothetical protein
VFNRGYGEAGFQFLKLHMAPRTQALAGSGAALQKSSLEAGDINPASAVGDSGVLYLGQGWGPEETKSMTPNITWSLPAGRFSLFLGVRFLRFEELRGFDDDNKPKTNYGAHTFRIQAGLAGKNKSLSWGASLNYAEHSVAFARYRSYLLDLGFQYELFRGLVLGAAANNADFHTSAPIYSGNEIFPPTVLRAGAAYTFSPVPVITVTAVLDARTRNDEKMNLPSGLEFGWQDVLFLRTGYAFMEPETAQQFGAGVKWRPFVFDYAYKRHKTLGPGHNIALGIRF